MTGAFYTSTTIYGSEVDVLLKSVARARKQKGGCQSSDLVQGTLKGPCLECEFYPYLESNAPCVEEYTLQGILAIDNQPVRFTVPTAYTAKTEALTRVLYALGGLSSRTVKIKTKGFTDLSYSINNVIPATFEKELGNRESESEKGDQT